MSARNTFAFKICVDYCSKRFIYLWVAQACFVVLKVYVSALKSKFVKWELCPTAKVLYGLGSICSNNVLSSLNNTLKGGSWGSQKKFLVALVLKKLDGVWVYATENFSDSFFFATNTTAPCQTQSFSFRQLACLRDRASYLKLFQPHQKQ